MDVLFRLRIAESEELLQERDAEENVHVERPTAPLGWVEFRMPLLREREIDVLIHALKECFYPCDFRLSQGKIGEGERGCVRLHGKKGNGLDTRNSTTEFLLSSHLLAKISLQNHAKSGWSFCRGSCKIKAGFWPAFLVYKQDTAIAQSSQVKRPSGWQN